MRLRAWWIVCLPIGSAAAQGTGRGSAPTLHDVLEIALRRNPDIVQARLRVDSAHGERRIARAFPNPTYSGIPGNPYQYGVSLPIDVSPERWYRTRAASQGEAATRFAGQDVVRQVRFNVRAGFYDLLLAEAQRRIAVEERDIFRQLLEADSVRLRAGDIPERDVVKTELEVARADAAVARADLAVHAARLGLQALMGMTDPDTGFVVTGLLDSTPELTAPTDSLLALSLANRPDLTAAQAQVDESHSLKSLATASLVPVPVVSVVYQHTPFESGLRYAFGVSLPVPLFYWNGGERQRANAGVAAADVGLERLHVQIESDVALALAGFRSARVLAERYQAGLLAKSTTALESTRFAYQQGAVSLLEMLDAVRTYGDTRAEYYGAVHDAWVAAYALSRAVGADIVRERGPE